MEGKETEVHVRAADVGNTGHCLYGQTFSRRELSNTGGINRELDRWRMDKLQVKEKREELQEAMAKNAEQ